METIRQFCPQCSSTLELPSSAMGRMARCPACQNTFRVAPPAEGSAQSPIQSPSTGRPVGNSESYTPLGNPDQPTQPQTFPSDKSPTYTTNPYTQTGSPQPSTGSNPYAFSPGMGAFETLQVDKAPIVVRTASIDQVVSASTSIFSARWQPLVLSGLVYYVGIIAVGIINFGANIGIQAAQIDVAPLLLFAIACVAGIFNWYLSLGLMNVGLMSARGLETGPSKVFVGINVLGRLLIPIVILSAIAASPNLLMFFTGQMQQDFGVAMLTVVGSLLVGLATGLVMWTIWPMFFLIIDQRYESGSPLSLGFKIGTNNLLNGFLMALIAVVLSIAATFTCTLGTIVTQPLMMLIGAIAYLMMTSQPISDPNRTPYQKPNYGT